MVARREAADVFAHRFNDARGLMAERDGHWARAIAVDHGEIGVAESGCVNFDQKLSGTGGFEFYISNDQRF